MIINLKEISFGEYLAGYSLILPPLGTYHVRHSLTKDGVLLGAYLDEELAGIAVLEFAPRPILSYVFVADRVRKKGIGTQLVQAALVQAESRNASEVMANIIPSNEDGTAFEKILHKVGFQVSFLADIIRYANDEKCRITWELFMQERGKSICSTLARRGYKTIPFSEASEETLKKLQTAIGRNFPANLDPFCYINNPNHRFVPDYSFVTLKNNEPAAFITATTVDDNSLIFQQMSTAFRHQGSGLFLSTFAAFMDKFLGGRYCKMSAMVLGGNERMQSLVQNFMGTLAESIKTQNTYTCRLKQNMRRKPNN